MDKFNPQPEPPGRESNVLDWISFIFQYLLWIVTLPFQWIAV